MCVSTYIRALYRYMLLVLFLWKLLTSCIDSLSYVFILELVLFSHWFKGRHLRHQQGKFLLSFPLYQLNCTVYHSGLSWWLSGKGSACKAGAAGDTGLTPGSGRSPVEGKATHSSILAWEIPRTEEPGRLQSMGSQRARYNWSNLACMHAPLACNRHSVAFN